MWRKLILFATSVPLLNVTATNPKGENYLGVGENVGMEKRTNGQMKGQPHKLHYFLSHTHKSTLECLFDQVR